MSSDLRAKFQLDFAVGSAEPLQRVEAVLSRIDETLARMQRAANPFDEFTQPVARATQATQRLNETLTRTTGATEAVTESATALNETLTRTTGAAEAATEGVTGLNEALNETGASAVTATTGIGKIGMEAEAAATQGVTAMERLQAAVSRVRSGAGSYAGGVKSAGQGFHDAVQQGLGSAFGAAAAGFGVLAPVHAAAEYDNDLTHIGITLGKTGQDNVVFAHDLGQRINKIAQQTGQRSTDLVKAASFFSMEGYSLDRIMSFTPTVAKISTAYNAAPEAVAKTAFALQENLGIDEKTLPKGLAEVARVGKEAALPMEQLAPLFPVVAAQAGRLGVHGTEGLSGLAGMLAVIRKSTGSEGQATAYLNQFMTTLTSKHAQHRFSKYGVDMIGVIENAEKAGTNPLEDVLGSIQKIANKTTRLRAVADLFGNEQDIGAASALLKHFDQYESIKTKIGQTSPEMITKDYDTGLQSTLIRVQAFEDALGQVERQIGTAFVPVLNVGTKALYLISNTFVWLDKHVHGAATAMVTGVGAVLGLTAALGALGAVMIPLKAGFTLVDALTAGWLSRLARLGVSIIKMPFARLGSLLMWIGRLGVGVVAGLGPVGIAIAAVTAAVTVGYLAWKNWDKIKPMLTSLGNWISGWAQWLGHILMQPLHDMEEWFASTKIGHAMDSWMAHPSAPSPVPAGMPAGSGAQFGLHVTHDPGLAVRQTSGPRGSVSIAPDRGRMVNNP